MNKEQQLWEEKGYIETEKSCENRSESETLDTTKNTETKLEKELSNTILEKRPKRNCYVCDEYSR